MKSSPLCPSDEGLILPESENRDAALKTISNALSKKIKPRIFPGKINSHNANACDWGHHGLLAYACSFSIVIVDTFNYTNIQVLDGHKAYITLIKWSQGYGFNEKAHCNEMKLASADSSCHIRVWDVRASCSSSTLYHLSKSIAAINWLSHLDPMHELLLALYIPHTLILWNSSTGSKIWNKSYTYAMSTFTLDPFCSHKCAFLSQDSLVLVEDLNIHRCPSSNGKKLLLLQCNDEVARSSPRRQRSRLDIVAADPRPSSKAEDSTLYKLNECVDLLYHKHLKNILLLVMPREILVLDLEIMQCIGVASLEKMASPAVRVLLCCQKDVLFCLHENNSISVLKQCYHGNVNFPSANKLGAGKVSFVPADWVDQPVSDLPYTDFGYEIVCQSDSLRYGSKYLKPMGILLDPRSEADVALIGESKILFFKLFGEERGEVSQTFSLSKTLLDFSLGSEQEGTKLALRNVGIMENTNNGPTIIKMCPSINTRNHENFIPLLAVGNTSGHVQIYNMFLGEIVREISALSSAVKGIEWVSQRSFLCYGYSPAGSQNNVRNELGLVNSLNGNLAQLRKDIGEESNITSINVSYLMQYFLILFHDHTVELWDVPSMMMLRLMPKRFPIINCLAWSPVNHYRPVFKRTNVPLSSDISITSLGEYAEKEHDKPIREQFMVCDQEGQIHNFSVDQGIVRDSPRMVFNKRMGNVSLAWKSHYVACCEGDGHVNMFDIRTRKWNSINPERGPVLLSKFSPGNTVRLLLMFNDGIDIWDPIECFLMAKLQCPKDMVRIVGADWVTNKNVILLTHDGCLRLMNEDLLECSAPIVSYSNSEYYRYMQLLPNSMQLSLLHDLAYQPWHNKYSLSFEDILEPTLVDLGVVDKVIAALNPSVRRTLETPKLGTAHRALIVAQLFGHIKEVQFWRVALYYLLWYKEPERGETNNFPQLPQNFDLLLNNVDYQRRTLSRLMLHESRRNVGEKTDSIVQKLILHRQNSRAVQLLMETDIYDKSSYLDSLKACLVEAVKDSTNCHTIVKMVSTNLIAAGQIFEGVELLCLIDKRQEACQYLQNHGYWEESISLAKCTLQFKQYSDLVIKWADHLFNTGSQSRAILMLMTIGQFEKCVQLLLDISEDRCAALLAVSCQENQLLTQQSVYFQRAIHNYNIILQSLNNKEDCRKVLSFDV